jgi:hypothetical protein
VSPTNGGVVIQAVKDVTAAGALYFSSAANSGNLDSGTSGTWEGNFVSGGSVTFPESGQVHNFGGQNYNVMTRTTNVISLFWSDPLGASVNDYDIFRLNSGGTVILDASTSFQDGTQDPFELFSGANVNDRIVILKFSGDARFMHLDTNRGRLSIATAGNTHGHAATTAANSFGVAATPAQSPGPYPGPFNAGNVVESFSSDGPRRIFFTENGTAITPGNFSATGGQVLNKPDITAADGVSVTGAGGFGSPFFGTSAAAPHAAAIAALVKSANPGLTAAQIRTALVNSAIDIHAAGLDRDSGYGIIMADIAVGSVVVSPPSISTQPQSQTIAPGATATMTVSASGTAPLAYQWFLGFSGTTTSPIGGATSNSYMTPALAGTKRYWVRVSNGAGTMDSNTATITVSFTDTVLTAGSTTVRVEHVGELRTRVNEVRVRLGLAAFGFTDSLTAGTTMIRGVHIAELRTALAEAYTAAGMTQPSYTDPVLTAGITTIKSVHIAELRNAVIAIE